MGNWTKTKAAGLLFVAAAAVYSDGLVRAMAGEKATSSPSDAAAASDNAPVAAAVKPAPVTAKPTVAPAKVKAVAAAGKPASAVAAKPAVKAVAAAKPAAPATGKPAAKPAAKAAPTAVAAVSKPKAAATKTATAGAKPVVKAVAAATPAKSKPAAKAVASKVVASKVVANQAAEVPTVSATSSEATNTEAAVVETATTAPTSTTQPVDPFAETVPTNVESIKAEGSGPALTDANVNVSDAGLVEIHVNDANLGEVLKMLSAQLERNIMASKEVRGTVTANLYDVTVKEALDAILRANDCGYREKGNVLYVYTKKELEEIEKAERKQVTETFRVYYTPAANAVTMIKPVLSPEAQVSFTTPAVVGLPKDGGKDAGGNSHATEDTIVVTDFPERIDAVRKVLKEVDRRPQQILVEAVILRATLKEDNELGVDFNILGGVDMGSLANIPGQILGNTPTGEMAENRTHGVQAGGSGLKVGVISNSVSVFVNALEGVTDTAVVANPKVLVLNKQPGAVHVGARLGYRTAVSTETLTADDVKFLEIGTRLSFRPYIGNDGYIRMEISPKDSSGNISTAGLPNEFVTEVTSNVMVRDGRTIVIGGLFRESTDSSRSQVPGLGNIPVAGHLFKKTKDSTVREEVIILLTPHIIKDEDAYERVSEEELKTVERMRVGTRRGMMPWGRERLADSAYQKAVEELNKPNPDRKKALWHLDCATNLNPKFVEAIALKAQLTGEEVTASDGSTVRSFVQRNIMAERRTAANAAAMAPAAPAAPASDEPARRAPVAATQPATTQPVTADADATANPEWADAEGLDGEMAEVPGTDAAGAEATELTAETGQPTTQPTAEGEDAAVVEEVTELTEGTTEEMPADSEEMNAEEATPEEVTVVEEPSAEAGNEPAAGTEGVTEVAEVPTEEAAPVTETPADQVQDVLVEIEADDAAVNK